LLGLLLPFASAANTSSAEPPARMWDVLNGGGWTLMVRSIERQSAPLLPGDEETRPADQYAIFTIDLTNDAKRAAAPNALDFTVRSAQGPTATNLGANAAERAFAEKRGAFPFGVRIAPKVSVRMVLVFDIPPSAFPLMMRFQPIDRDIRIDECSCSLPSPSQAP
jgi:hypothetical protein